MDNWKQIAGDTWEQTVSVPGLPATDGWTLKYRFTPRFTTPTQAPITITATASGADYLIQVAPSATAVWSPGFYGWARWVEKTGARQTLDAFPDLQVIQDPATAVQGFDGRSQATKAVADCEAAFAVASAIGSSVLSYTIGSRQLTYQDIDKAKAGIIQQLEYWKRQLNLENDAAAMAKGLPNPRNVGMRLNRL